MKVPKITIIVIIFAIIDLLYIMYCPAFPSMPRPEGYAFWRCVYYLNRYFILGAFSIFIYTKVTSKSDEIASLGSLIYSTGKTIFYLFLINKDLPTYINILNDKTIDTIFSIFLWGLSIYLWYIKFKIKFLFRTLKFNFMLSVISLKDKIKEFLCRMDSNGQ